MPNADAFLRLRERAQREDLRNRRGDTPLRAIFKAFDWYDLELASAEAGTLDWSDPRTLENMCACCDRRCETGHALCDDCERGGCGVES